MRNGVKKYHKVDDIIRYYRDWETVSQYEKIRFTSPIRQIIHNSEIKIVERHIPENSSLILDIPIGTGRIARKIGISSVGVDSSKEMIKVANQYLINWNLILGDAFFLPLKSNCFDCVYSFAFIGHFNDIDRRKLYNEIYRILRKKGVLIFDVVHKESKLVEYLHQKIKGRCSSDWVYYTTFKKTEIEKEIQSMGFKVVKVYIHNRMFLFKVLDEFLNLFVKIPLIKDFSKKIIYKIEKTSYKGAKRPYKLVMVCQK